MVNLTAKQIRGKLNHMKGDGSRMGIQLLGCMQELESVQLENKALREIHVRVYNQGYGAGHNDTVESCYTDIYPVDADTYHADEVTALVDDLLKQALENE